MIWITYLIPNIPIEKLSLAIASESYGAIIQYIGSVISCSPLFNKSFTDAYNYICKDNGIKKRKVYESILMNNKTFYNHINNKINSKQIAIDICIASGFDLVLTMVFLSLKGIFLNPHDEKDNEIIEFINDYDGDAEDRLYDYIEWFRPKYNNEMI